MKKILNTNSKLNPMKTILNLFFALTVTALIGSCNDNHGSGTDHARKGSISTQPGQIENTNTDSSATHSLGVDNGKGNKGSNKSKADSVW
jgi:hypothetical protein